MLQKLAGRLTWEPTGAGIRVEIPARRSLQPVVAVIVAISWTVLAWFSAANAPSDSSLLIFIWTCLAIGAAGLSVAVGWLMWSITGRTMLNLDRMELKIQWRAVGVGLGTNGFTTRDIYNLRYIAPGYIWAFRTDTDPNTSKVQFCVAGKTRILTRGITEREACALVNRMLEICPFPKDRSRELAGTAQS